MHIFIIFILVINAESAAHKAQKFTAMAVRTRYEYLKDLATNFVTTQTIESGGAKFSESSYAIFCSLLFSMRLGITFIMWFLIQRLSKGLDILLKILFQKPSLFELILFVYR